VPEFSVCGGTIDRRRFCTDDRPPHQKNKIIKQQPAKIVRQGYRVVITHGNGPQVGDILIRSYLTRLHLPDIPLDMANAITHSEIGYMIQQSLKNELLKCRYNVNVATVVTQVLVDKKDRAFSKYSKPVGPFYSKKEAFALESERKWVMREDAGRGYRRLVSSPMPKEIVEIRVIRALIESGVIVIACGGGGIPVFFDSHHKFVPAAAVIDKDLSSSLLSNLIDADILLISTGINRVFLSFNKPNQQPLYQITLSQAKKYFRQGYFESGSMGPKIDAAIKFLQSGNNRTVIITNPSNIASAIFDKRIGTRIVQ
jgi:carbamate kinase